MATNHYAEFDNVAGMAGSARPIFFMILSKMYKKCEFWFV
jgi:hypothetical protein